MRSFSDVRGDMAQPWGFPAVLTIGITNFLLLRHFYNLKSSSTPDMLFFFPMPINKRHGRTSVVRLAKSNTRQDRYFAIPFLWCSPSIILYSIQQTIIQCQQNASHCAMCRNTYRKMQSMLSRSSLCVYCLCTRACICVVYASLYALNACMHICVHVMHVSVYLCMCMWACVCAR